DEVYGTFTLNEFGCRWGWMRLIDVADPARPFITGEFMIGEDRLAFCGSPGDTPGGEQFRSFSSPHPTVVPQPPPIDGHAGGLQAIDIGDPTNPTQAGEFRPEPIPVVANEDPALSAGPATTVADLAHPDTTAPDFQSKVVFWSYPIISDGLIYLVDVRNGLFVLRYRGAHHDAVDSVRFLEGNSNLGDA